MQRLSGWLQTPVLPKSPIEVIVSVEHASALQVFRLLFLSLIRGVSVFISASKTLTYPSGERTLG